MPKIHCYLYSKTDRYNSTVKHQRGISLSSGIIIDDPGSDLLNLVDHQVTNLKTIYLSGKIL